jgi:hypothetical protein
MASTRKLIGACGGNGDGPLLGENKSEARGRSGSEGVTFPSLSRHGRRHGTPRARERATWLSPSDAGRPQPSLKL